MNSLLLSFRFEGISRCAKGVLGVNKFDTSARIRQRGSEMKYAIFLDGVIEQPAMRFPVISSVMRHDGREQLMASEYPLKQSRSRKVWANQSWHRPLTSIPAS